MYFDLKSFVWFILGLIIFCESKVILNFRIYDYRNPDDIKHDGKKCESFSWLNDLCDPMFQVCVTSKSSCDVLNLSMNHRKNKKYVYNVLSKEIKMDYMPDLLITEIKVEDHDRYDAHDHIAVFHSKFQIFDTQKNYRQKMTVKPANLNVHLYASIKLECEAKYYGLKCDTYCEPKINNYKCVNKTGDKICDLNCGIHGLCSWNQSSEEYMCSCKSDWTGDRCQSIHYNNCSMLKCNKKCVNDKIKKYCVCNYGPYTEKCTEIFLSKIKTAKTTTTAEIIHNKSTIKKEEIVLKSNVLTNTTPYILLPNGNVNEMENVPTATENSKMSKKYKVIKEIQTKKNNKVSDILSITTAELFINNSNDTDTFHYYNKNLGRSAKDKEYEKKEASKQKSVLISQASYSFTTIIIMCILLFLCLCTIALIFVIRNWKNRRIINKKLHPSSFSQNTVAPVIYRPKVYEPRTSSVFSSNSLPQTPQYDYDTCTLQSDCNYETHLIEFPSKLFDENEGIYEEPINENKDSFPYQTEIQGNIEEEVYQEPNKF